MAFPTSTSLPGAMGNSSVILDLFLKMSICSFKINSSMFASKNVLYPDKFALSESFSDRLESLVAKKKNPLKLA